jgi:hypothetical protein
VFQLPPDGPELNAQERMWHDPRQHAARNRFFEEPRPLCQALLAVTPEQVRPRIAILEAATVRRRPASR